MQIWHLFGRSLTLSAVGIASGLAVHALRGDAPALGWYAPAAACEVSGAAEPLVSSPQAISALCASGDVLILDTRDGKAFAQGHVAGATHLPCSSTRLRAEEILQLVGPRESVVVYGRDTQGALEVARSLSGQAVGLQTFVIDGGFDAWQAAALACVSGPCDQCGESSFHAH